MSKVVKYLLLIVVILGINSCSPKTSCPWQIIDETPRYVIYKIDDTHILCVPNTSGDKDNQPLMFVTEKVEFTTGKEGLIYELK